MTAAENRYYRNSGAVPLTSTMSMLFGGMAASALLGLLFELLKHWIHHEIVQVAAALGFGALVGMAVQFSAKISHVRNPNYARFVGLVIGLFAVYSAWFWYIGILSGFDGGVLSTLLTEPNAMFQTMQNIAAIGLWKMFDWHPQGGALYAVWTVEALMVVGFAVGLSANNTATYCEDCRRWTTKFDLLLHLPLVETDPLKNDLEEERYANLYVLLGQPCDMNNRIDVTAVTCPMCTNSNFLNVIHTWLSGHHQGQPIYKSVPIVKNLIVPYETLETLKGANQIGRATGSATIARRLSRPKSTGPESPTE